MRPEARAADVELLVVADDRPVDGDINAQDSGSSKAAWAAGRSADTLWTSASLGKTMYSAMAPGVRCLKP